MDKGNRKLNTPIVLGTKLIKNRLVFPNALPKMQQGPETFPADPILSFYSKIAENGAGIICYADMSNAGQRELFNRDEQHFPMYDTRDPSVENYISQVADCIHYYGSKVIVDVSAGNQMNEVDVVDGMPDDILPKDMDHEVHIAEMKPQRRAMTEADITAHIQIAVKKALYYKRLGFDGGYLGLYQGKYGNFLSKELNTRADQYGGDLEDRARFPLRVLKEIREAVGDKFLLVLDVNRFSKGLTFEDAAAFTAMAEPYVDLILLRIKVVETAFEGSEAMYQEPENLRCAEFLRAAGIRTPIAAWTGFQELSRMEEVLKAGTVDMILSGRFQLANPKLKEALITGDEHELLPCILCNRCHGDTLKGPWLAKCSINPQIGFMGRIERMVKPISGVKRVAVIGGGPAGMSAAMYLRQRGHQVDLYERDERLGGQLLMASIPAFKWPVKRYLEKLTQITNENGTNLFLRQNATPEELNAKHYDALVLAMGATAVKPNIPGAKAPFVRMPTEVYGHETQVGQNVICIGGSETSVETALYLSSLGKSVQLVTRKKRIASDANPIHYVDRLRDACYHSQNLKIYESADTIKISMNCVEIVQKGSVQVLYGDTILAAGGVQSNRQNIQAFAASAPELYCIGDCEEVGNIAHCVRTAFAAASQI